jgi:hypothetical protein
VSVEPLNSQYVLLRSRSRSIRTATLLYDLGRCGYPKITIEAMRTSLTELYRRSDTWSSIVCILLLAWFYLYVYIQFIRV